MRNDEIRNDGMDRLVPLSDLSDFKVAKEDPDARGWKVIGADGQRIGKVKDLIVDPQALKARYLAVEVDRKLFNEDYDRHLLVPIGAATLDREDDKVFVPFIDRNSIAGYPVYQGGPITEEYEYAVREAILGPDSQNATNRSQSGSSGYANAGSSRGSAPQPISDKFYEHEHFNEKHFYSKRQQEGQDARAHFTKDQDQDRDRVIIAGRGRSDEQQPLGSTDQGDSRKNVEESISTLERLDQLRAKGTITEEEFKLLKKRALDI